jgi:hypothetical protein
MAQRHHGREADCAGYYRRYDAVNASRLLVVRDGFAGIGLGLGRADVASHVT